MKSSAAAVPSAPGGNVAVVDLLQQPFVAGADQIRLLEVDHVPNHVGGLDLLADLLEPAVIGLHQSTHSIGPVRGTG